MENIKYKKRFFVILAIILIGVFCISLTPKTLQNDTFYTIKIGEHIIENGEIDMLDPFSWHENLEYTYPHWLYDVIIYLIYSVGGMTGIYISTCCFSIILGATIFLVNKKIAKNEIISFVITLLSMYLLKDYIAARAQLVTFILFIIEIYCIERLVDSKEKKYMIGLIILSVLIANLHVAVWPFTFVLYLPYIAEYIMAVIEEKIAKKYGKEPSNNGKITITKKDGTKLLIITLIICIFTGFLTPLGTVPYTYLIKTMQGNTTQNINEHQPLVLINDIDMICLIIAYIALLLFSKNKISLTDLLMLSGLTLLTFFSKRQATMLILIGSIILNKLIVECFVNNNINILSDKIIDGVMSKFGIFMITSIVLIMSIIFIKPKLDDEYIDESSYPVEMSDFILEYFEESGKDISQMRLYNEYNYGSYLLFRGIPVFIDSRADLYAPEFNEGVDVFTDFIQSSNISTYFGKIFDKYDITHVILYKNSKMNMIIKETKLKGYKLLKQDKNFVFYEIEK